MVRVNSAHQSCLLPHIELVARFESIIMRTVEKELGQLVPLVSKRIDIADSR